MIRIIYEITITLILIGFAVIIGCTIYGLIMKIICKLKGHKCGADFLCRRCGADEKDIAYKKTWSEVHKFENKFNKKLRKNCKRLNTLLGAIKPKQQIIIPHPWAKQDIINKIIPKNDS